jgi:hypothetical protein
MKVRENLRSCHKWNREEDNFVRKNFITMLAPEIAAVLGSTRSKVLNRIFFLGLRLPAAEAKRRKDLTQFKKGHFPFNKGLRGLNGPNKTSFKKGDLPKNTKYDGAISVRYHSRDKKNYKWIRLSKSNWMELSRYNWQKEHGKIPTNCNVSNLKLITRAEHARLNQPKDFYTNRDKYMLKSDRYIASKILPGASRGQRSEFAKEHPELIQLKRSQIILGRKRKNES